MDARNFKIDVSKPIPDHREYVEEGKSYDFRTIAIHQLSSGVSLIMMEYVTPAGEHVPLFGVRPFAFQEEGGLTPTVRCLVKGFRPNGIAELVQDKVWLMNLLYKGKVGMTASFTAVSFRTDAKTNKAYCQMRDAYGVNTHRYYPKPTEDLAVGQQIELEIVKVAAQYLELKRPTAALPPVAAESVGQFGSENSKTEFKTSIVFSAKSKGLDPDLQIAEIAKEIAAFLNAEGGTLYIGVDDHGTLKGIADDMPHLNEGEDDEFNGTYKPTPDGYELKLRNAVKRILGATANSLVKIEVLQDGGLAYCKVDVQPSKEPVYWHGLRIYQRAGCQKQMLQGAEITTFIKLRTADLIKSYISTGPKFGTIVPGTLSLASGKAAPSASAAKTEPWLHFTWYKDGEFSFQKNPVAGEDVVRQVMIPKGYEQERLVFCYANGCVNMVVPQKVRSKKNAHKRYKLAYSDKAELLAVFPAHGYDLLAVASVNAAGEEFVKCHPMTDFAINDSMKAQGSSAIPTGGKDGSVVQYAKLDIVEKNVVPNLLFKKNQTTQSIGINVNDVRYADEIRHLLSLIGYAAGGVAKRFAEVGD